jgi:hypothetical protein
MIIRMKRWGLLDWLLGSIPSPKLAKSIYMTLYLIFVIALECSDYFVKGR